MGYMQYLDLVRDCIEVFGLEPLPPNDVRTAHELSDDTILRGHAEYAAEDIRLNGSDRAVSEFNENA